ncbi:PAS domain S-box-containing protein [Catalinimonas alkaloidigena]|uniref:histidine kinase n=1 Tax=Catalinimonas alkaloidigena TaxID=1075417 RepID=A0A1G9IYT0_9BACT|nr:ATP-binding protein [Catalinimonas alkaloidigena]SDL30407.1 PAS domain S-box-containing protein [Catalinimonas alkaloidigena]
MLYEISAVNSGDSEAQLDAIVQIATNLFHMDIGIISRVEGPQYTVLNSYHFEGVPMKGKTFDRRNTYCDITLASDDVQAIEKMAQSPWASHPCYTTFRLEAYIGIPLHVNGQVFGTLNFSSPRPRQHPFTEEDRRTMRIMGSWISNILANQENLRAIQKSEAQYRNVVEHGLALLGIHDLEGTLVHVNKTMLDELNYQYSEMVGRNIREFMMPVYHPEFEAYLKRITAQKTDRGVVSILTKAGHVRYWSYKNTLNGDEVIGFAQDVTEAILAQKALKESEENLKEAQALGKIGSWELNLATQRVQWSEELFRIFELDVRDGPQPMDVVRQYIHPAERDQFDVLRAEFREGGKPFSTEFRLLMPRGHLKHVHLRGSVVPPRQPGAGKRLICTVQDVTEQIIVHNELVQAKDVAEEAARLKQEFLANMSHEIRTPMNAILGFSRLLCRATLDQELDAYARSIYDSAENLLVVINDILDFSKIEAGKLSIEEVDFDLRSTLDMLHKLFQVRVEEGSVHLGFYTDTDLPPALRSDPVRINQILSNLIGNAIKFTDKGRVTVTTSVLNKADDHYDIQFSVEDTGIGIPEEKQRSIFNSFEQAQGDVTRRFGGTGLGLTIVKKLVELMGGEVWVESVVGQGSAFMVVLPIKLGDASQVNTDFSDQIDLLPLDQLQGKRILLAEDNRNNQLLACKFLSEVGCEIDVANNGSEAVELAQRGTYDLILMDIQMPEMDGIEATRQIKALPSAHRSVPILAMTAHALKNEENEYIRQGMNGYISKPFKPQVLYSKLLSVLNEEEYVAPPAPATAGADSPVPEPVLREDIADEVDLNALREYADGDEDFLQDLMQVFLADVPQYLDAIQTDLDNRDWKKLDRSLHSLKSSVGFFGMKRAHRMIADVELRGLSHMTLDEITTTCATLVSLCEQAMLFLRTEAVRR